MSDQGSKGLTETVRAAIEAALLEARTCTPARVQSYTASEQRATVVPLLQRRTATGEVISAPPISDVPVLFPRGGGFAFTLPLAAGDVGLLLCSDRSLDRWLEQGGVVDPQSRRHHSLTDALFLPGLHHWGDPIDTADAGSLVIAKEDGSIRLILTAGGKLLIRGASASTSPVIVDGVGSSLHTSLASTLTELSGLLAGLGLLAPTTTTTVIPALSAGTWKATKAEGQ